MMIKKFSITGMTCSACSAGIERTISRLSGVHSAEVSLMNESLKVDFEESILNESDIIQAVIDLGYGATLQDEKTLLAKKTSSNGLGKRFLLSILFLVPLMYFSMGGMIGLPQPTVVISACIQALLSLVIIGINFKFFSSGTKALLKGVPNMDTLVSMGSAVSFIYSLVLTILYLVSPTQHHLAHLFYESAAMILVLVTLGKWLEEKSKRKTGEEIEKLINLMPNTVCVEVDAKEKNIPFSDLAEGDILIVKQGEYVPVDGKVISGQGFVNRAAVTGESMPIEVFEGCQVTGADILQNGYIKVIAEKVGSATTLSQIVRMVKEAGASKAPIQKLADKIAAFFVPFVTLIAAITFFVWLLVDRDIAKAANFAICVLVISCPCSLGLATPVAVMAAMGRGMSLGILYKNADVLQKTKDLNCVLLDKTATLTIGKPQVTDFECFNSDKERVLSIALALETHSNHPIAECICAYVQEFKTPSQKIEEYVYSVGAGASAKVHGTVYYLGNRRLLPASLSESALSIEESYSKQGKTAVFLANEQEILAVFAIADTLKPESKEIVFALQSKGVRVGMLTGDNENVAQAIASEVGIKDYFAEALPQDKKAAVERVRSLGGYVAMVGDGVNDSPALKEADIGIAMGDGTDIAMDTAEIVLSRGDLRLIDTAIELSKATVLNIKENLFWAFLYNCIAIPVAAGVFAFAGITLNPMIGALCMSLSSLCVVLNALRLTKFMKKTEKRTEEKMDKTLIVEGMMCQHCVAHVTKALQSVEGVTSVDVNLKKKTAVVSIMQEVSNEVLVAAIEQAGYTVTKIK